MYNRQLNLLKLLKKKSIFLFGPRATGKSTLIKESLDEALIYDLLDSKVFAKLSKNPNLIDEQTHHNQLVVIDEIQKLPMLLDEVHRLIEKKKLTFLLTGSSARKLKRKGVNLLAGRAWSANLFALTTQEIDDFDLLKYLNIGGLPMVYISDDPLEELESYVATYLLLEIQQEALTRNIQSFNEFLELVAISNGQEINYQSMAKDCGVSANTLKNYFDILDDTLIGFELNAFTKTKKRKAISRAKYWLFDIGITNFLAHRKNIQHGSKEFGEVFEHFIMLEMRAFISYSRNKWKMNYWRSTSGFEVDLIINESIAIEIKSSKSIISKHLKGLKALKEENLMTKYICVCLEEEKRVVDAIEIIPYQQFLEQLWSDKL